MSDVGSPSRIMRSASLPGSRVPTMSSMSRERAGVAGHGVDALLVGVAGHDEALGLVGGVAEHVVAP